MSVLRRPVAACAVAFLVVLVAACLAAPLLAPDDPRAQDLVNALHGPSGAHLLGADTLGRDVLSRLLYGGRRSLLSIAEALAVVLAIGVPLGLLAGYRGGWIDAVIMRPLDMVLSLPALLLAVSLIAILGQGAGVALVAIAVIYLPILARVLRSSVLVVRERPFVTAARARGVTDTTTMVRHVLPNAIGPALVQATVLMGFAIQVEAALSFLGLGAQPPTASLGLMLLDGYQVLQQAWWVDVFPGLGIAVAVVAFFLIGDGLRRRYDPAGMAS